MKLDPIPLGNFAPSILSEGCGTGRAYVVYLAQERQIGLITFNHCASLSCLLDSRTDLEVGFIYDLNHSAEWHALSPGRAVNLGLSAPGATTWSEIHHFKIPFGGSTVSVFATDYNISTFANFSHVGALAHCVEDLKCHHARIEKLCSEIEDTF